MEQINANISISRNRLTNNKIDVVSLMMLCGISPGGATARRQIRTGALFVNDIKVADENHFVSEDELREGVEIKMGKKIFVKAVLDV